MTESKGVRGAYHDNDVTERLYGLNGIEDRVQSLQDNKKSSDHIKKKMWRGIALVEVILFIALLVIAMLFYKQYEATKSISTLEQLVNK